MAGRSEPSPAALDGAGRVRRAPRARDARVPALPAGGCLTTSLATYLCADAERLLTSHGGFGLTTATPIQRAICRVLDGRPLGPLAFDPVVLRAFGGVAPTVRPNEYFQFSGVRVGKTLIASMLALHWSQTCDVSPLRYGEVPRIPLVSITRDLAKVAYDHLRGTLESQPALKSLMLEAPTDESIIVRHPTGRPIEIMITAGSRAGASVSARWLAGAIFDEFPKMSGEGDAVVNWDHMRGEAKLRILKGGQIANLGSPWAPFGPAYDIYVERFGKPDADAVVVKAPAYDVNPFYWTPEKIAEAKREPAIYITNVEAEFASREEALFATAEIERASRGTADRPGPLELAADPRATYVAAIDPATRGNGWCLVVATREGRVKKIVMARQWIGTALEPLSPRKVMQELAAALAPYRVSHLYSDQVLADALRDYARDTGLNFVPVTMTGAEQAAKWIAIKMRLAESEVELSPHPMLKADLQRLRKRVTQSGVTIDLPKTSDGRHCDFAPPTLLVLRHYLADVQEPPPVAGTQEYFRREEADIWKRAKQAQRAKRHG